MGSRRTGEGVERVYAAAEKWVERALRTDGSLFTPGKPLWSSRWLGDLRERFLDQPDKWKGSDPFGKLEPLLAGSPPEVYQLMAEAMYVSYLIVWKNAIGGPRKKQNIDRVLGWSPSPSVMPDGRVDGLSPGLADPGQFFKANFLLHPGYIIELVDQWKEQEPDERPLDQSDPEAPWEFKRFVHGVVWRGALLSSRPNSPIAQQEALLHLVHPDTFEAIVTVDHKERITKAFEHLVTQRTDDVDRKLQQIRLALEGNHGYQFHFYEDEIFKQWDPRARPSPNPNLWVDFVRRAREFSNKRDLDSYEVDYKLEIGRELVEAREAALDGADGWVDLLKGALKPGKANFVSWRLISDLNKWCVEHPDDALTALEAIWTRDDYSVAERIRHFRDLLPRSVVSGTGSRTNLASALLMGLDAQQSPPFQVTVFEEAYKQTEYPEPEKDADEAALYEHALGFLDRFREEAEKRGLSMRHPLDAQSYVWGILKDRDGDGDPWAPDKVAALAGELRWETRYLQKIVDGLKDKRQAIFQGPPGTGKTYVAKRIAEWCREHGGDFQIVQLHPSYSYEDFVEGFRPTLTDGGQAGFKLTDGPLKRIAEEAEANTEATFILVIDEINRGNVAKVLGELYFLLEYRDEKVRLQYSNEPFSLPKNLWFIGTMNTTDRSIALVDAALRRRFYFFGFFPDEPPVKDLLDRWLEENNPKAKWVAALVDLANRKLEDRHLGIGPSHFMKKDPPLDENRVRFIWEQAVIPYIEEQCFGDEDKLKEFAYDRLKGKIDGTALGPDAGSGQPEGAADAGNGRPEDGAGDAQD